MFWFYFYPSQLYSSVLKLDGNLPSFFCQLVPLLFLPHHHPRALHDLVPVPLQLHLINSSFMASFLFSSKICSISETLCLPIPLSAFPEIFAWLVSYHLVSAPILLPPLRISLSKEPPLHSLSHYPVFIFFMEANSPWNYAICLLAP